VHNLVRTRYNMKYERGIAAPPDMNKRQDNEFGFGPNLFGSTPPPSVGGDAPSFPSGVWHCCLKLRITFLFSRRGAGTVEGKSVRTKNNELLPSGLNSGSDNKFKTASLERHATTTRRGAIVRDNDSRGSATNGCGPRAQATTTVNSGLNIGGGESCFGAVAIVVV
jgi:hypothetical protein